MAEQPLTDDEIKKLRAIANSWEFCDQCEQCVPTLHESKCYGDDGYYTCYVCHDCKEQNK